ncbi:MAG: LLM class flavin-dependent oxidoreductase, partial [Mesorhizobium sp.]
SGTALKVAGKHADVFELAAGSPDEVRQLIERARGAAAEHGRAGRLRFALPVRIHADGWSGTPDHKAVEIAGPPARIALALLPYAALGIEEFMISGIDRPGEIARIGRETITLLANSLARREAEIPQPGAFASSPFAERRIG